MEPFVNRSSVDQVWTAERFVAKIPARPESNFEKLQVDFKQV